MMIGRPAESTSAGEVAGAFGGGRQVQVAVLRQPVTIRLGREPEERLVADDRPADATAAVAPDTDRDSA